MEKINFEAGTQVSPAKVTIDNVEHEIIPSVWEGNTPLSPFVLNKLQDNIENAIENKRLKLEGKSEQETSIQGKNYFTGNKIASESNLGITYNFDNSILKLNGTVTAGGSIIEDKPTKVKLPAGTYTYFIKVKSGTYEGPSGDFALYIRSDPNTFITGNSVTSGITGSNLKNGSGASSKVITITEEKEIFVRFFASNKDIKFNNLELEIQIEKGNSFTGFEQFVPNSPTPDYPSRIRNVGDNINLFDKDNVITKVAWFDINGNITDGGNSTITTTYIKIPKGNISIYCEGLQQICLYDESQNFIKRILSNITDKFTLYEEASYIRIQYETAGSDINSIKLEQGSIASPYTPYGCGSIDYKVENADKTESKNIHFPLSKGQVIHEGDYVDSIGIHQKRKTLVLTGNETITRRGYIDSTNKTYRYSIKLEGRDLNSRTNLICSHLPTNENYGNNKSLIFGGGLNEGNIAYLQFVLDEIGMTDVTKINEYFKTQYANGTPVIVEYELAKEIVTPLTKEQIEAFYELQKAKYVDKMELTCLNEIEPILTDIEKSLEESLLDVEKLLAMLSLNS